MEPIPDPQQEQKNKNKITKVITILFTFLLIVFAALAGALWLLGANERNFYAMLDNAMQVSYIERNIKDQSRVENSGDVSEREVKLKVQSDFSNPAAPNSAYDFEYSVKDTEIAESSESSDKLVASGSVVSVQDKGQIMRLEESTLSSFEDTPLQEWVEAPGPEYGLVNDPGFLRTYVTRTMGAIIIGNFKDNDRKELIDYISSNNVYNIVNVRTESEGSKDYKVYEVAINGDAMAKLSEKLNEVIGIKGPVAISGLDNNIDIWVDQEKNLPVRIVEEIQWKSTNYKATKTTDVSYPKAINVSFPNDYSGADTQ